VQLTEKSELGAEAHAESQAGPVIGVAAVAVAEVAITAVAVSAAAVGRAYRRDEYTLIPARVADPN
jgi:hypothetical protein